MRIYGLTGGTGSGKSEAARRFAVHGIPTIDADAVGHDVIAPEGIAEQDVIDAFGPEILTDGAIDRAKLASRVFNNPEALDTLNRIVHPAIKMTIALKCAAFAEAGHEIVIIDAALLADSGRKDEFLSGLIVVTAPEDVRVRRLMTMRGFTEEEARRRIRAQVPPERKLALADWVIDNSGDMASLHAQVDNIAGELKRHGA